MSNERGNSLLIGIFIGLILAGGLFGAYLLGMKTAPSNPQETQLTSSPSMVVSAVPSPMTNVLPDRWTLKKSANCNVSLPFPPKEEPYITSNTSESNMDSGAFWQVEEYNNSESQNLFTKGINVFYRNPNALGSGYIAGIVSVQCAANTGNLSTDGVMVSYENWFNSLGNGEVLIIASKKLTKKWGRDVWEIYHKGGMYDENNPQYFFATPTHIYSVNQTSMSRDSFVKETTTKIFENINFQ